MVQTAPALTKPAWDDPAAMVGVDEARERILAALEPLDPVALPIDDLLGLVLAEEIVAEVSIRLRTLRHLFDPAMSVVAARLKSSRRICPSDGAIASKMEQRIRAYFMSSE